MLSTYICPISRKKLPKNRNKIYLDLFICIQISEMDTASIDSLLPVCEGVDSIHFEVESFSAPGKWSSSVPGSINPLTGYFYPTIAKAGTHVVKYTTNGFCSYVDSVHIVVKPRVNISFDNDENFLDAECCCD